MDKLRGGHRDRSHGALGWDDALGSGDWIFLNREINVFEKKKLKPELASSI